MDCWQHSCREAIRFAKHLQRALKAVGAGGTAKDLWLQTGATKLVIQIERVVENKQGLTLDAVVPLLIDCCRLYLLALRDGCHDFKTNPVERGPRARRDTVAAYPTKADWDKHVAGYWRIVQAWDDALSEVDKIMADVATWEPILAKEIKAGNDICLLLS
jgi:hypothetical protein